MAGSKSWFPGLSPERARLSLRSSHELPRWRTPSPMTASIIPPPIAQSVHASSSRAGLPMDPNPVVEQASPFEDRQHELEADLQFLLDAQAEGLIRGLEGGSGGAVPNGRSSTGSTTPTTTMAIGLPERRFRKPATRRPGLRSARKGIYNSIVALATLKDDELEELNAQVQRSEENLERIEMWERKRLGLQEASHSTDSSEDTTRVQRLQQEADAVQDEINQVELHLMELKSKHRKLLRQAAAVENSVQARLASYTSSLRMLEEDVQKFLSLEPEDSNAYLRSANTKSSVWQLPARRRTLQMAREFWNEGRMDMTRQRNEMEGERTALTQGAELWRDAVAEITNLERRLRAEVSVHSPSSSNSNFAWEDPPQTEAGDRMKELLNTMTATIGSLEAKHQHAEEQGWRLLIAAIGAELDALRRGQQILEGVLGTSLNTARVADDSSERDPLPDAGHEIHELDKSFETARRPTLTRKTSPASDDPDPELLFSTVGNE